MKTAKLTPFKTALIDTLVEYRLFFILASLYLMAAAAYLGAGAGQILTHVFSSLISVLMLTLLCTGIARLHDFIFYSQPHYPIRQLARELFDLLSSPASIGRGLPQFWFGSLFVAAFWMLKAGIPINTAVAMDLQLTEWDRTLHFATLPWQWLQPLLGYWPVTFVINWNYQIWLLVIWGFLLYFLLSKDGKKFRTRYVLSFMATWIVCGSVLATLVASAGPCYYAGLGISPNPYQPLMDYLYQVHTDYVPLPAVWAQELLWTGYTGKVDMPLGISAMPSLHNGVALLNVLASWKLRRRMAIVMAIHAVLVALGSVHLGWHYALDVYIAWAITLILWAVSSPVARWWDKKAIFRIATD